MAKLNPYLNNCHKFVLNAAATKETATSHKRAFKDTVSALFCSSDFRSALYLALDSTAASALSSETTFSLAKAIHNARTNAFER